MLALNPREPANISWVAIDIEIKQIHVCVFARIARVLAPAQAAEDGIAGAN